MSNPLPTENLELRQLIESLSLAERHTECCICFEDLYEQPSATLTRAGRNACPHFFHAQCAERLLAAHSKCCPQCRAPFDGLKRVPVISDDPDGWFFVRKGRESLTSDRLCPSAWRRVPSLASIGLRSLLTTGTPACAVRRRRR